MLASGWTRCWTRPPGSGRGGFRLAVLSGNGERLVDGTALRANAELWAWLGEALGRHRSGEGEVGGRFRLRLLDAGGRAAGSVVIRGDDLGVVAPVVTPEERRAEARPAPDRPVPPEPPKPTRAPGAEAALRESRGRIAELERQRQATDRRAQEASVAATGEISRLRAEVRELDQAAGRASTTAGDTRRGLASAQGALALAQWDARKALARAEAAEAKAIGMERDAELRVREAQERAQKAIARADGAEKRVAALEGELGQAQAREAALEGAATGLRKDQVKLSAEIERRRGIVKRQHTTIDEMDAQGEWIVAKVDELVGDDEERPRRRRR